MRKHGMTDKQYIRMLETKIEHLLDINKNNCIMIDEMTHNKELVPMSMYKYVLNRYETMKQLLIQYNLYTGQ